MAKFIATEFIEIAVIELRADETIPFDLYVHLPLNEHVVKVRVRAEVLETAFIERCRKYSRPYLHVHVSDKDALKAYLDAKNKPAAAEAAPEPAPVAAPPVQEAASPAPAPAAAAPEQPVESVATATLEDPPLPQDAASTPEEEFEPTKSAEEIMGDMLSDEPKTREEAMASAKAMVQKILESAPDTPDKKAVLDILDNALNEHSSSVAVYAALFAMGMNFRDQTVLQDLIKASLLHDLGMSQLPVQVFRSLGKLRSPKEQKMIAEHVELTKSVAAELGIVVNPRVMTILEQHHEKFDGTGYPKSLESFKIDELAQVICLADFVSNACLGHWDGKNKSLDEALADICFIEKETSFPHYLNPMTFKKIMKWVKAGSGKDYLDKATDIVQENKEKLLKAS